VPVPPSLSPAQNFGLFHFWIIPTQIQFKNLCTP
jgi:hypothetical protein